MQRIIFVQLFSLVYNVLFIYLSLYIAIYIRIYKLITSMNTQNGYCLQSRLVTQMTFIWSRTEKISPRFPLFVVVAAAAAVQLDQSETVGLVVTTWGTQLEPWVCQCLSLSLTHRHTQILKWNIVYTWNKNGQNVQWKCNKILKNVGQWLCVSPFFVSFSNMLAGCPHLEDNPERKHWWRD